MSRTAEWAFLSLKFESDSVAISPLRELQVSSLTEHLLGQLSLTLEAKDGAFQQRSGAP